MTVLCFDNAQGDICQLTLSDASLLPELQSEQSLSYQPTFDCQGMVLNLEESDQTDLTRPLFFEWQRLDWLFEPAASEQLRLPLSLLVNNEPVASISCRTVAGRSRLTGSLTLENCVGFTDFQIVDANGETLFKLKVEVFPQKLDYRSDFPAMLDDITEVLYSLAFDSFTRSYASVRPQATANQSLSEWLNLFKVLSDSLMQSLDTLVRLPRSELVRESRIKPIERVRKGSAAAVRAATKRPDRFLKAKQTTVAGLPISHLPEQHKHVSFDTVENRFVVWAVRQLLRQLARTIQDLKQLKDRRGRIQVELDLLERARHSLQRRIKTGVLSDVGAFEQQAFFSTTLTMAAGYKEFYHRFLLMRKGLSLAENELFKMDFKDIATLYEYWCFLKTVSLLKNNPRYRLEGNSVIRIEHHRLKVSLMKGKESAVHFVQQGTGDQISMYYNRTFNARDYTHTYSQIPDQFIEFSRSGFGSKEDPKTFKLLLDAKYRFDRGSSGYPSSKVSFGPPLDTIAQLHRYRDAILWQQDSNDSFRVANKSIGGVILFPFPGDEEQFRQHPFFKSIEQVNIGALPLQPGYQRANRLFQEYLDSLFEQPGEVITESRIHQDMRDYLSVRQSMDDVVLVGLMPTQDREDRLKYHLEQKCFYTRYHRNPEQKLENVKSVAIYDQSSRKVIAIGDVTSFDIMLGGDLVTTGVSWQSKSPNELYILYRITEWQSVAIPAGKEMTGRRVGRNFIRRLGIRLAIQENQPDLQLLESWGDYQLWKKLKIRHKHVHVKRERSFNPARKYELVFTNESGEKIVCP